MLSPGQFAQAIFGFVFLLASLTSPGRSLKCYICHTNDNAQCQLRNCPADQAYDRCMTTLYRTPPDGKTIKKECALGPCHLRGLDQLNFVNFKTDCESSKQEDCVFCCAQDGCNKDAAQSLPSPIIQMFICLILSALSIHILLHSF